MKGARKTARKFKLHENIWVVTQGEDEQGGFNYPMMCYGKIVRFYRDGNYIVDTIGEVEECELYRLLINAAKAHMEQVKRARGCKSEMHHPTDYLNRRKDEGES